MTKNDDTIRIDEELTSYLDGELEPEQFHAVEKRLASDDVYRSRLQELQKTWDLLDHLPRPERNDNFTRSTIELVAQSAALMDRKKRGLTTGWVFPALLVLLIPVSGFLVAAMVTRNIQNEPIRKLTDDLALLENFDFYRNVIEPSSSDVECISFVENLRDRFPSNRLLSGSIEGTLYFPQDQNSNRERLQSRGDDEKATLQTKRQVFSQLTAAEKKKMRMLHESLLVHEDRDRLVEVLKTYDAWLMMLNTDDVIRLRDLGGEKRQNEVERLMRLPGYSFDLPLELSGDELEHVHNWYEHDLMVNHLVEMQTYYHEPEFLERLFLSEQGDRECSFLTVNEIQPGFITDLLSRETLLMDHLLIGLSERTRLHLSMEPTLDAQREIVFRWIASAKQARSENNKTALEKYYRSLTPDERRSLIPLPSDRLYDELRRMIRQRMRAGGAADPAARRNQRDEKEQPRIG